MTASPKEWPDTQNQSGNDGSSSGTADEDIRAKSRPGSADSQTSKKDDSKDSVNLNTKSLPSLSSGGAALLQLRGEAQDKQSKSAANEDAAVKPFDSQESENQDEEMNEEDDVDDLEDASTPPSPHERDVRILFHGREVFAEDLIGLRVAKTFAGHGRFLGQVVKFDHRSALYTVVYADGDAEDLSIDSTLQILIQDEIERADPAQIPAAVSLLFKKGEAASPASPDTGDFMAHPQRRAPQRVRIQVSEREAQFVISLFENHALPSLVRLGWRVQTSNSGRGESRFVSSTGEVFVSALDVVGYIASDNELLTSCFPANVHSAILSLLPPEAAPSSAGFTDDGSNHVRTTGGGMRKRTSSDSPGAEQFDGKRTRQLRDEGYGGSSIPMRGVARGGGTSLYRPDDLDRRAEAINRVPVYRGQAVAGRIRTVAPDRYSGGETTSEPRIQAPPELRGYRRTSSRDLENPFTSRWPSDQPGAAESAEYHRRYMDSPSWRVRGDLYVSGDRILDQNARSRARVEGRLRLNARGEASTPIGYQYRDPMDAGQASPMTNGPSYSQYASLRTKRDVAGADYRFSEMAGRSAGPRVPRETASFMSPTDTLGANAAFSMVDVDRISKSRPGSNHLDQSLRGRSPRHPDGQEFHRRSGSYHSQRGGDDVYGADAAPGAQAEHNVPTSGASSAPTQTHD